MARFQNAFVALLKKTMLPRAPLWKFTEDDLRVLQQETGLECEQILIWAENFRFRVPEQDRTAALQQDAVEKVGNPV